MSKFYFFLWLRWLLRVLLCSLGLAFALSFLISSFIYINQGMLEFSDEVMNALLEIFQFSFPITLSFTLLIALFRALKYIFNQEVYGYKMNLLECDSKKRIEKIGYGDLVKVWRKWFMIMIWLVTTELTVSLVFIHFFISKNTIMEWFDIYYISVLIFIAGYFSFIILGSRCDRVKIVKC